VITIEQNFGPQMEQKCTTMWAFFETGSDIDLFHRGLPLTAHS
tara:strand:- start:232 stop:360 length:129 start_codon:yes stop_codon:yes gene_type:complete